MRLSSIGENQMGDALAGKLGPTYFAKSDLSKPTDAEPEKDFVRSGSGAGPRKKRHRRFMKLDSPEPGV